MLALTSYSKKDTDATPSNSWKVGGKDYQLKYNGVQDREANKVILMAIDADLKNTIVLYFKSRPITVIYTIVSGNNEFMVSKGEVIVSTIEGTDTDNLMNAFSKKKENLLLSPHFIWETNRDNP